MIETRERVEAGHLATYPVDGVTDSLVNGQTPLADQVEDWLRLQPPTAPIEASIVIGEGAQAASESPAYVAVDGLSRVAAARQQVRQQAWDILRSREEQVARGDLEHVPLPIDALSTARRVRLAGERYGEDSSERQELFTGLQLDCQRLMAEWYRKNTAEYFPRVHRTLDVATGEFYSHGLALGQMTENALTPSGNPEENARRVNERAEEATPSILRRIGGVALKGAAVRTISECTDTAISEYRKDMASGASQRGYDGYVPGIEKLVIRDIRFDEVGDRWDEQMALSGIYITADIIEEALRRRRVDVAGKTKTERHGTQMLVRDDLIDFVELLDTVASEEWCVPIFKGEVVSADHPRDYSSIREEARLRQESLKSQAGLTAQFVMDLEADHTDPRRAPALVEEFVKRTLISIARKDPSLAVDMFDEKTSEGLRRVNALKAGGQDQEAAELMQQVIAEAPDGGYCQAGSCGLEALSPGSPEAAAVRKLGFDPENTIKDNERDCGHCGCRTVFYDLTHARKGCTSCGQTAQY